MLITRIEEGRGKKYRVYGDEQFLFSLYGKELKKFKLNVDSDISEETISNILETVIYKRAKERALFLLEKKPLSIHMLIDKLKDNEYPQETIRRVIRFLEKYNYVDDLEYTRMYVSSYSKRKSKKQIICDLYQKGVSKDIIDNYFDENEYIEKDCFIKQFHKYTKGKNLQDYATRQKVFRYFYRKGFSISLIDDYLQKKD